MFPTEKNVVPLIMRDGIPINCFLSPTLWCHKCPIQHSHHKRLCTDPAALIRIHWHRSCPWRKDSPAGLSHQSISLEQPGLHGHLIYTSFFSPGWWWHGHSSSVALWGHRHRVRQCPGAVRMIYAQPCLEKQMHVSDKTIFYLFFSPLFILKCWRGFQQ